MRFKIAATFDISPRSRLQIVILVFIAAGLLVSVTSRVLEDDVAVNSMLVESCEQIASHYDFGLIRVNIGVDLIDFGGRGLINRHRFLGEVLRRQVLERNVCNGSIVSLVLERSVRNERRDVLFDLGKVLHDVILSECDAVLVVLSLGHAQVEFRLLEHLNHGAHG